MKLQNLKKRLITESAIIVPVILLLGGGVFMLETTYEEANRASMEIEFKSNKILGEKNILRSQYDNVQKNAELYRTAVARNPLNGTFSERKGAEEKFYKFNNRYRLGNLKLTVSPAREIAEPRFKRKTSQVLAGDMVVEFTTISDIEASGLMQAMQKELLGMVKIQSMKMSREEKMSDKALRAISQRGTHPLIKGEIRSSWMGIKPIETPTVPGAPPNVSR